MKFRIIAAIAASLCVAIAYGQEFPLWESLLAHYGGKSDETPVPTMMMGPHMQMSLPGEQKAGDTTRADAILAAAHGVLIRYADVQMALKDGYKPFHPTGRVGEEVHYTNYRFARKERQHVNYNQPGSILYKRTADGMTAVGVMFSAPRDSSVDQLDAIVPMSIATWHRHVDFCGGPKSLSLTEQNGPTAKFGFKGSIHTAEDCQRAGGLFIPVVFGWMTHVYPDSPKKWGGMDMDMESNATTQ